jgi:lactoylglutathione lyase
MAQFRRIDHIALHVADIDRSIAFYERHFGCRHYFEHRSGGGFRIAYLRIGDTTIELVARDEGGMNGFHFCFETDDFDGAVAGLKAEGIACIQEPHDTPAREPREEGWRRVVFRGPDGENIELRG